MQILFSLFINLLHYSQMASASNHLLLSALLAAYLVATTAGFQFEVGEGRRGWRMPTGNESQTYDEWAEKNRFRIGDTLYFKYENDSVMVVSSADYSNCNTSNPIAVYEDGNTVFQFARSGLFYFISGEPDHCKSGQKLIVRVMHPSEVEAHAPELALSPGGWDVGPSVNSTAKLMSVVSYLMSALGGVFVALYLFV